MLKCLYTTASSIENTHSELVICVQLQGYDLVGIMEAWWNGSHYWSVTMERYRLLGKTDQEDREREFPFL